MGIVAFGHELAIPFAEPDLGLPADGLDHGGELFQPPLEVSTALGRIAGRPGAFDEGTTRMRLPGLGTTALLTPRPTGIFRGREAEISHELSGVLETRQVSSRRHGGHCDSELDATQSLEGFDHWREAPGFDLRVECEFQTSQTVCLFGDGLDVFLKDDLLRRGGTHHLAEPAQVGGTPVGPPRLADIVPQQKRFQPQLGRLASPQGLFPRPTQVADRFLVDGGDIHGSKVP